MWALVQVPGGGAQVCGSASADGADNHADAEMTHVHGSGGFQVGVVYVVVYDGNYQSCEEAWHGVLVGGLVEGSS